MARKAALAICVLVAVSTPAATAGAPTAVPVRPDASALAVSDDGRFVVTGDDSLRVWDRRTGKSLRVLSSHGRSGVGFGGMTASGRRVLVVQSGRTISQHHLAMWDRKVRRTTVISKDLGEVLSATLSPDGRYVGYSRRIRDAAGKIVNTASLWDRRTGRVTLLAKGSFFGYLTSVSRDAGLVVVTDLGAGETFAYEPVTGRRTVLTVDSSRGLSLAAPDGDLALVSTDEALSDDDIDNDSDVYLWDRATGDFLLLAGDLDGPVLGAGVFADGGAATLYTDVFKSAVATLRMWRADNRQAGILVPRVVPNIFSASPTLSGTGAYVAYTEYGKGAMVTGPLG